MTPANKRTAPIEAVDEVTVPTIARSVMRPSWGGALIFLLLYVALDWITYLFPVKPLAITPWNPHPGVAIGMLLLVGIRAWPVLLAATLVSELLVRGVTNGWSIMLIGPALLTAGYTFIAWLLSRVLRAVPRLQQQRDLFALMMVSAACLIVISSLYVGSYTWLSGFTTAGLLGNITQAWIGDVLGILTVTPLVLVFGELRQYRQAGRLIAPRRLAVQVAVTILTVLLVVVVPQFDHFKWFYLMFLPLIWIALTNGLLGAVLGIFLIQSIAFGGLYLTSVSQVDAFQFQMLMGALAITGLYLGMSVNERQRSELRLRDQQDKFSGVLQRAGSAEISTTLAHELNQPLSAIGTYASACLRILDQTAPDYALLRETLQKAAEQTARAGRIVHRLRDFFRAGGTQLAPVSVRDLLTSAIEVSAARRERHRVALALDLPDADLWVLADRLQIETVVHNLLGNAIDALVGHPGAQTGSQREIRVSAEREGRENVRIEVIDNGPGIDPAMREHLFELMTTTKPTGMGLGLAVSHSLVDAHGSTLQLKPTERGCCFSFTLPLAERTG